MADDLTYPLLASFLGCATAALDPPPSRAAVTPGTLPAWDECCEGFVWTRLISLQPTAPFPQVDLTQSCGVLMWVATIGIGALRCAAVVDDQGRAPTAAVLSAEAAQMTADTTNLAQAIQCCMFPLVERGKFVRWDPLGPDGGCVGGEWQIVVAVPNCRCP